MIHRFSTDISQIPLPERFTYPFHYSPHPLTVLAAQEVERYLSAQTEWQDELAKGKMFGVLVVRQPDGQVGFTAAFSGILASSNHHDYFVPPIYDLLQPDGYFRQEEAAISAINHRIDEMTAAPDYLLLKKAAEQARQRTEAELTTARQALKAAKARRDERRRQLQGKTDNGNETDNGNGTAGPGTAVRQELEALIRESQFEKADYKRKEKRLKTELEAAETAFREEAGRIEALRQERKARSAALQQRLFRSFRLLNARGEWKDLTELFADTSTPTPPAGAGECALPKLLQHAFLHHLHPLAFGEFWWGASPKNEVRHHGYFYPSCQGKCAPILRHTLCGLEVDTPSAWTPVQELDIVYEDEWIVVVNKPAGLLSVPGKEQEDSVLARLRQRYPTATGPLLVHRLDMDTSGLLLAAKTKAVHEALQQQFEARQVTKRYTALLDGILPMEEGDIRLPLAPDWLDRPRQKVDPLQGKPALTHYRIRERRDGQTLVDLFPHTGRTHQLRVHAAHVDGLNAPIVGDPLYGRPAKRLCLHAAELTFTHPVTKKKLRLCREAEL
ncbi:MAG: pseudouridine synthase [Bacteroidales bacterium]|nr:pseudouridine synthase [Bacteroidales bacterium]